MSKVVVLTTGGTIASLKNESTGLYMAGAMSGEQLVDRQRLGLETDIEVASVFQLPSNAMDFEKLMLLRDRIALCLEDHSVDGVVVTHGTDTLEESSYFMDLVLDTDKPVVFTGAQRTPGEEGTDAYANIRDAVVAAACPDCRGLGVLVAFNQGVYSSRHVRKMHAFNVHAFTAPGFGQLGYTDKGQCFIAQRPARRESYAVCGPFPRVALVKACLGDDGGAIGFHAGSGAAGIVLEGLGRGHVIPAYMDQIRQAVHGGVRVVITSACGQGRVYPVYGFAGGVRDLQSAGVLLGHDYPGVKARIKLTVLLAAGLDTPETLQKAFDA